MIKHLLTVVLPLSLCISFYSASVLAQADVISKEDAIAQQDDRIATNAQQAADDYLEFPAAVELYTQDKLNDLINKNKHLQRVKADDCQLVDDIKARAVKVKLPSYQFLWGDMLAWGVCVDVDAELGLYYMREAAKQGLPRALEQLGRYYVQGQFVQQDKARALPLLIQSANLGFLPAQIQLAELLVQGYGSAYDYEAAYAHLYSAVTADKKTHNKVTYLLRRLEQLMPAHVVASAKKAAKYK